MANLEKRDLGWVGRAPVTIEGSATTTAPPESVFAVLADHVRWPEWFPGVKSVEVTGDGGVGVGATRRVKVPGAVFDEEFIAWDPAERWAFTGTNAKPKLVSSIVEDCQLTPTPDGGTRITYTMHIAPAGLAGLFLKLGQGTMRKNLAKAMQNLAHRAEHPV